MSDFARDCRQMREECSAYKEQRDQRERPTQNKFQEQQEFVTHCVF